MSGAIFAGAKKRYAQLRYINSAGIASLGLFLIKIRDHKKKIKILASKYTHWQATSFKKFKKKKKKF